MTKNQFIAINCLIAAIIACLSGLAYQAYYNQKALAKHLNVVVGNQVVIFNALTNHAQLMKDWTEPVEIPALKSKEEAK